MGTALTAALALAGSAFAASGLYLMGLSIAALFYREDQRGFVPRSRLVVLVPAHDEELLIARCVQSLRAQSYPAELFRVVVVADNCTDATARCARAAGASEVLIRECPDSRGKGPALGWALDQLTVGEQSPDAFVIVDADSVADRDLLLSLVRALDRGASAVQGEYLLYEDGPGGELGTAAFILVNRVRPAGRAVLRIPQSHLSGNGMLFATDLLRRVPWTAFSSAEDLEYALTLRSANIAVAFAGAAKLRSPTAPTAAAAAQQQLRWHGGQAHLARTWVTRLTAAAVRERRPSLLLTAFELAIPPLSLMVGAGVAGACTSSVLAFVGILPTWLPVVWLVGLVSLPVYVVVGLQAAGAPISLYGAFRHAPRHVLNTIARAGQFARFRGDTWVRTDRQARSSDDLP